MNQTAAFIMPVKIKGNELELRFFRDAVESIKRQTDTDWIIIMLRELIDHIDVYEKEGNKKHYTQRIMIYYRFVGYIEIPMEPDYENYTADTRQGVEVEYIPTDMFPAQHGKSA